ncbi:MAG: O-methyltransferase involved in polyketide biosynthesis [Myxococcota bacterium]
MVYFLSGAGPLTNATHNRQSTDQAAVAAGHIRVRLEGDPFASRILPAPSLIERLLGRPRGVSPAEAKSVVRRAHYFDHALTRFLSSPDPGQVVLLVGRYDTRPWRFAAALGDRPIFAVAANEAAGRIRVDPEGPLSSALRSAGFKPRARSLFLWEGGAMFSSRAEVKATLSAIHALSGPGSLLVMDGWSLPPLPDSLSHLGQSIRFAIHPEDLSGLLARLGFEVTDVADADELQRRFPPEGSREVVAGFVMTARLTSL